MFVPPKTNLWRIIFKGKRYHYRRLDEKFNCSKVALGAWEEGATFTFTNAPIAMRMGEINKLAEKPAQIIPADATNMDDLIQNSTTAWRPLRQNWFCVHSIGMSVNIRKNIPYTELNTILIKVLMFLPFVP